MAEKVVQMSLDEYDQLMNELEWLRHKITNPYLAWDPSIKCWRMPDTIPQSVIDKGEVAQKEFDRYYSEDWQLMEAVADDYDNMEINHKYGLLLDIDKE